MSCRTPGARSGYAPVPARERRSGVLLLIVVLGLVVTHAPAEDATYTYDKSGRLIRVDYLDGRQVDLTYDAAGNLVSRTVVTTMPVPTATDLRVGRSDALLEVRYGNGLCNASDHALFVGAMGDFATVTGASCNIGNEGVATTPMPSGDVWLLVAGVEGTVYSSVGAGTAGERVVSGVAEACSGFVQDTSRSCP